MTDLEEIKRSIINGAFDDSDLQSIAQAITFCRAQLAQRNRRSMVIGTSVKFTNTKTRQEITGKVVKVALKFVHVQTPTTVWRVPASMLSLA